MRYALMSDIHANPIALRAVLADVEAIGGVDTLIIIGDLVANGHDPVAVLEHLVHFPDVLFVRGNTDRYTVEGTWGIPTLGDVLSAPHLLDDLVMSVQNYAWTRGIIASAGWLGWLSKLPLEVRVLLPDGT